MPAAIWSAARDSASTGIVILRDSHHESRPANTAPTANAAASRMNSGVHCPARSSFGVATMIAPKGSVSGSSLTGSAAARNVRVSRGGTNSNTVPRSSATRIRRQRRLRHPHQPRLLSGEDRRAGVEDAIARRLLDLRGREVGCLRALVRRAQRGVRVQLGQPGRLTAQLVPGLVLRVVAKQLQCDRRGEQAGEEDGQQEEGWKPEAKRPEHP